MTTCNLSSYGFNRSANIILLRKYRQTFCICSVHFDSIEYISQHMFVRLPMSVVMLPSLAMLFFNIQFLNLTVCVRISTTRWQYCLSAAIMITRWHYYICAEMVTGRVHWIVNVSNCKQLWIARRKHQHLQTTGKHHEVVKRDGVPQKEKREGAVI